MIDTYTYTWYSLQLLYRFREFTAVPYGVKFILEVENYTNYFLHPAETYVRTGHISCPPAAIPPGEKHGVTGHKQANTATGCEGEVR